MKTERNLKAPVRVIQIPLGWHTVISECNMEKLLLRTVVLVRTHTLSQQ